MSVTLSTEHVVYWRNARSDLAMYHWQRDFFSRNPWFRTMGTKFRAHTLVFALKGAKA